jgi:sugar/nucleoside kinase (ribokinase family)
MTPEPRPPVLDLLVVGGLTVDRFADGSAAPGGSVLHASLAAHDRGARVGAVTAAGPEPEAEDGLRELRRLAWLEVSRLPASIQFAHDERGGRRRLVLAEAVTPLHDSPVITSTAVLFAPVAGEIGTDLLVRRPPEATAAAILQGWLRRLVAGEPVRPLSPGEMDAGVLGALGSFDLLVASREDLEAVDGDAPAQLATIRSTVGVGPTLVLTGGAAGAWVDLGGDRDPERAWHEWPPHVVEGVSSVGAGDMLAALLLVEPWPRPVDAGWVKRRMAAAMLGVADRLAARRG